MLADWWEYKVHIPAMWGFLKSLLAAQPDLSVLIIRDGLLAALCCVLALLVFHAHSPLLTPSRRAGKHSLQNWREVRSAYLVLLLILISFVLLMPWAWALAPWLTNPAHLLGLIVLGSAIAGCSWLAWRGFRRRTQATGKSSKADAENASFAAVCEREVSFLELLFDRIDTGIVVCDHRGQAIYQNAASGKLSGGLHHADEGLKARLQSPFGFFSGVDHHQLDHDALPLARALRSGQTICHHELLVRDAQRPEGHYMTVLATPLQGQQGQVMGAVMVMSDTNELKRKHLEEQRQAALARSAPCALISTDLMGHITAANRYTAAQYGYQPEELIGQHISLLAAGDQASAQLKAHLATVTDDAVTFELAATRKNGEPRDVMMTVQRLEAEEGVAISSSSLDITLIRRQQNDADYQKQLFTNLFNFFPHLIWLADAQGEVIYFNKAWLEFAGYLSSKQGAQRWLMLIHPDEQQQFISHFQGNRREGEAFSGELRLRSPQGSYRDFSYHIRPVVDGRGRVANWTGAFIDVSEHNRLVRQAQHNAERLKLVVASIKDHGIVMLSREGLVVSWSSQCESLTFYAEAEARGKPIGFFLSEHPNQETSDEITTALMGEGHDKVKVIACERWVNRRDGTSFLADLSVAPIADRSGGIIGYSLVIRDITRRKQEEAAKYRDLYDNAPDLYVTFDAQNLKIVDCNSTSALLLGYSKHELIGLGLFELFDVQCHEEVEDVMRAFAVHGCAKSIELSLRKKNGCTLPVSVGINAISNKQSRVHAGRLVMRDISQAKNNLFARRQAERANRAKTHFLANMSHEIRTPLASILTYGDLLTESHVSNDERKDYLFVIQKNAHYLGELVDDILDVSKIETGKLGISKGPCNFLREFAEAYFLLQNRAKAFATHLRVEFAEKIPVVIDTDAVRMRQILMNIVGNAIKFSPGRSVSINVEFVTKQGCPCLRFLISDTGIGITFGGQKRLFGLFSQEDSSTTRKFGGTGLGLYISKRLALALGGDVQLVSSALGQGSTFEVTINPGEVAMKKFHFQPKESDLSLTPSSTSSLRRPTNMLTGMKILLAEDNLDLQFAFKRVLSKQGAAVDCVDNGREAIAKALADPCYHVVFMDLQMPIMDGYTATQELRKEGYLKPIVAVTAVLLQEEIERCLQYGFTECISKPTHYDDLLSCARKYLKSA